MENNNLRALTFTDVSTALTQIATVISDSTTAGTNLDTLCNPDTGTLQGMIYSAINSTVNTECTSMVSANTAQTNALNGIRTLLLTKGSDSSICTVISALRTFRNTNYTEAGGSGVTGSVCEIIVNAANSGLQAVAAADAFSNNERGYCVLLNDGRTTISTSEGTLETSLISLFSSAYIDYLNVNSGTNFVNYCGSLSPSIVVPELLP